MNGPGLFTLSLVFSILIFGQSCHAFIEEEMDYVNCGFDKYGRLMCEEEEPTFRTSFDPDVLIKAPSKPEYRPTSKVPFDPNVLIKALYKPEQRPTSRVVYKPKLLTGTPYKDDYRPTSRVPYNIHLLTKAFSALKNQYKYGAPYRFTRRSSDER